MDEKRDLHFNTNLANLHFSNQYIKEWGTANPQTNCEPLGVSIGLVRRFLANHTHIPDSYDLETQTAVA